MRLPFRMQAATLLLFTSAAAALSLVRWSFPLCFDPSTTEIFRKKRKTRREILGEKKKKKGYSGVDLQNPL